MQSGTIDATGETVLGDADPSAVGRYAIQFVSNSFSGSVTIKGRVTASGQDAVAISYMDYADSAAKVAAITGDALVLVDVSGLDLILDCTVATSGSLEYFAQPLLG